MKNEPNNTVAENIFVNPDFEFISDKDCQRLGLQPHRAMYSHSNGGVLVLLLELLPGEADYRMYVEPLERACELQEQGKVAGSYLVQCRKHPDGSYEFIASTSAFEVRRNIRRREGH
jgi:hypothetical protein